MRPSIRSSIPPQHVQRGGLARPQARRWTRSSAPQSRQTPTDVCFDTLVCMTLCPLVVASVSIQLHFIKCLLHGSFNSVNEIGVLLLAVDFGVEGADVDYGVDSVPEQLLCNSRWDGFQLEHVSAMALDELGG